MKPNAIALPFSAEQGRRTYGAIFSFFLHCSAHRAPTITCPKSTMIDQPIESSHRHKRNKKHLAAQQT
jgi:hypothetical protein